MKNQLWTFVGRTPTSDNHLEFLAIPIQFGENNGKIINFSEIPRGRNGHGCTKITMFPNQIPGKGYALGYEKNLSKCEKRKLVGAMDAVRTNRLFARTEN